MLNGKNGVHFEIDILIYIMNKYMKRLQEKKMNKTTTAGVKMITMTMMIMPRHLTNTYLNLLIDVYASLCMIQGELFSSPQSLPDENAFIYCMV